MLFELINELVTYQYYMNDTLFDFLNRFMIVYLNDILIYSQNKKKHREHVQKILKKLRVDEL